MLRVSRDSLIKESDQQALPYIAIEFRSDRIRVTPSRRAKDWREFRETGPSELLASPARATRVATLRTYCASTDIRRLPQ